MIGLWVQNKKYRCIHIGPWPLGWNPSYRYVLLSLLQRLPWATTGHVSQPRWVMVVQFNDSTSKVCWMFVGSDWVAYMYLKSIWQIYVLNWNIREYFTLHHELEIGFMTNMCSFGVTPRKIVLFGSFMFQNLCFQSPSLLGLC